MYRPEVGEECTFDDEWYSVDDRAKEYVNQKITVCALFENKNGFNMAAVSGSDGGCFCIRVEMLKPPKSEREETIERMLNATQIANLPVIETIFGALYDAGYRKQLPYPQFVSIIQLMFINDLGFSDESALDMARSLAVKLNHSPDKDNQDV